MMVAEDMNLLTVGDYGSRSWPASWDNEEVAGWSHNGLLKIRACPWTIYYVLIINGGYNHQFLLKICGCIKRCCGSIVVVYRVKHLSSWHILNIY